MGVEDLISIGTIGLIKAINTFNPEKNIKLATYASRCIENEILMYLRRNNKTKLEVSIDEPLNVDWDGNELLLSDILGTEEDTIYRDMKLNTVFIVSIAFGMGIILISMIFHIINGIRAKDTEATWFDANGVAGLVFYGAAVTCIVLFMTGHSLPGGIVLAVMFGVPLLLIALKEPLTNKIKKKTEKMEQSKAMFVTQAFFELFETLLSYFSNTLSFIRIGAFAVSHASIMEVVLMLAGAESGHINWVVIVLGNLFVCGFEGLIVGIQVLRLVYYEMFSRFYKGSGREFKPYTGTAKN